MKDETKIKPMSVALLNEWVNKAIIIEDGKVILGEPSNISKAHKDSMIKLLNDMVKLLNKDK